MAAEDFTAEAAYSLALELVACGVSRVDTWSDLRSSYPSLEDGYLREVMADALRDAIKQGVERDDVDPSWFASSPEVQS